MVVTADSTKTGFSGLSAPRLVESFSTQVRAVAGQASRLDLRPENVVARSEDWELIRLNETAKLCQRAKSSCRGADNMKRKGRYWKLAPITNASARSGQAYSVGARRIEEGSPR
jgi:hypothetical protein